jgi:type IV secretion system protein VirB9
MALLAAPAHAGVTPQPLANDARIKVIQYDRNDVTQLLCHYDFETTIQYAPDEHILRATAGIPTAWHAIPSDTHPNILTVQPKMREATTNLTVLTNKRVYLYELSAKETLNPRDEQLTYHLRYEYPQESQAAALRRANAAYQRRVQQDAKRRERLVDPATLNFDYVYSGDASLAPVVTFDNGTFTYMQFAENAPLPAIFAVDKLRNESMLNYRIETPYVVIEQLADRFTLRRGDVVTTVQRAGARGKARANTLNSAGGGAGNDAAAVDVNDFNW